ncbi:hypothetical protein [Streptomyces thioluteus]
MATVALGSRTVSSRSRRPLQTGGPSPSTIFSRSGFACGQGPGKS